MFEFPFIEFKTKRLGTVFKPFAFVELSYGSKFIPRYPMLIDSGADITLIPKSTGEDLSLLPPSPEETETIGGIGGGVPVVFREIDVNLGGTAFTVRVAWIQVEEVPPVLGRLDVFDKFDVEFKQSERKIIFRPK